MKFKIKNFVIIFLFIIIILFLAWMLISTILNERKLYEYEKDYNSLQSYDIDIELQNTSVNVNMDDYIGLDCYTGKTYGFNRENGMFSQFNSLGKGSYRYYINNKMIDVGKDASKEHCFLVMDESRNYNFCYKLANDYRYSDWYIKKDYTIPNIMTDHVKCIMIIPKENIVVNNVLEIPRVNTDNYLLINDERLISKCITTYKASNENLDFLKSEMNISLVGEYIVLAVFDNDAIYQFLGTL